jgi:hypothetical protein
MALPEPADSPRGFWVPGSLERVRRARNSAVVLAAPMFFRD